MLPSSAGESSSPSLPGGLWGGLADAGPTEVLEPARSPLRASRCAACAHALLLHLRSVSRIRAIQRSPCATSCLSDGDIAAQYAHRRAILTQQRRPRRSSSSAPASRTPPRVMSPSSRGRPRRGTACNSWLVPSSATEASSPSLPGGLQGGLHAGPIVVLDPARASRRAVLASHSAPTGLAAAAVRPAASALVRIPQM